MLHQTFNGFILSAMLLHQWRHKSVTIAAMELSNVVVVPWQNDVPMTLFSHQCGVIDARVIDL